MDRYLFVPGEPRRYHALLMTDNPYESPASHTDRKTARTTIFRIAWAIALVLGALPFLYVGTLWAMGGSRPHHEHIVVPLGLVTLAVTLSVLGVGLMLLFTNSAPAGEE